MLGLIIVVLIGYFLFRNKSGFHLKHSHQDTLSQWFLLLSIFFLGVTIFAFNRDFGNPLSWRLIILITTFCGGLSAYYFKLPVLLAASILGFIVWWNAQIAVWIEVDSIRPASWLIGFTVLALILYVVGYLHEQSNKFKKFSKIYCVIGILSVTGMMFGLSTRSGLELLGDMTKGQSFLTSWRLTLSLVVSLVVLGVLVLTSLRQRQIRVPESIGVVLLALLIGSINLISGVPLSLNGELTSGGVLWAILFNFAVFFELLALIFSGYIRKEAWLINLGTLFIFLLIIIKYFDWFFTFLDKSIFFIGAGILLFGIGWFMEKGRRLVVSNIKNEYQV